MVRERDLTRTQERGAAAEQTRERHRVMRCPERPGREHAPLREEPGDRVQLRRLERLLARELRQDRRETARQHGLAGAGRPHHEQVVPAGGGHLERPARLRLSADLREVDLRRLRRRGDTGIHPGGSHVPRRNPATSASVAAPTTRSDPIWAASSAFAAGTTTPFRPARAAAMATDRMPGVGRSSPFSDSSPANAYPTTACAGTCAVAASTPTATGRSSPGPSLRRLAGARFTTTRRSGHSRPALSTAGRTRSRASFTEAPGRPVKTSDGNPRPTNASTVTRCPPTPSTVTATTRPYTRGNASPGRTLRQ